MSKINRGIPFAGGLLLGVIVALLLVMISVPAPFQEYPHNQECVDGNCDRYSNQEAPISFAHWLRDSIISTPKDSLAQWSMTLLAFVGTFASIYAVLLLKGTLASTNKTLEAASDANTIMREEARPWLIIKTKLRGHLSCTEIETGTFNLEVVCGLHFDVLNKGKTPAFNYAIHKRVICTDSWDSIDDEFEDFISSVWSRENILTHGVLFPDESSQFLPLDHHEKIKRAKATSSSFTLLFAVTYTDSSGTLKAMNARAYAQQQESPGIGPWFQEFRYNPKFTVME